MEQESDSFLRLHMARLALKHYSDYSFRQGPSPSPPTSFIPDLSLHY